MNKHTPRLTIDCCALGAAQPQIVITQAAYDALVDALKVAQCEIEQGGTVDRELVMQRIDAAIKLARGKECQ